MRACWCGNADLLAFGGEYGECRACGSLVYLKDAAPQQFLVRDDERDFYGKQYWLTHQQDSFGYAGVQTRAREDLTERNLHWLIALLKYQLPPAVVVELGCGPGSFVSLLSQAGYEASGIEMSPWVCEFGQRTFGVPVRVGPVESLDLPRASLDVIALMDVLEHLPNPTATMRTCFELLKPNGILLVQTPEFKDGIHYADLVETKAAFLDQLKPDEHLYLFSKHSVTEFFRRLGAGHIQFEPAIFAHYDMFFVVSRTPFRDNTSKEMESALLATPDGRMVLALLDLRKRELTLAKEMDQSVARAIAQGAQIESIMGRLQESEADRAARLEQIKSLTEQLKESEADRALRLGQIDILTVRLKDADKDRTARGEHVEELTAQLEESEADRAARLEQIKSLTEQLKASEADRTARGEQIDTLAAQLQESEADRAARLEQIKSLIEQLKASEADRVARGEQIDTLAVQLKESEADRALRLEQILALTAVVRSAEATRTDCPDPSNHGQAFL